MAFKSTVIRVHHHHATLKGISIVAIGGEVFHYLVLNEVYESGRNASTQSDQKYDILSNNWATIENICLVTDIHEEKLKRVTNSDDMLYMKMWNN